MIRSPRSASAIISARSWVDRTTMADIVVRACIHQRRGTGVSVTRPQTARPWRTMGTTCPRPSRDRYNPRDDEHSGGQLTRSEKPRRGGAAHVAEVRCAMSARSAPGNTDRADLSALSRQPWCIPGWVPLLVAGRERCRPCVLSHLARRSRRAHQRPPTMIPLLVASLLYDL
jgi:hypothetical protein